jgi:hypothetical protein
LGATNGHDLGLTNAYNVIGDWDKSYHIIMNGVKYLQLHDILFVGCMKN